MFKNKLWILLLVVPALLQGMEQAVPNEVRKKDYLQRAVKNQLACALVYESDLNMLWRMSWSLNVGYEHISINARGFDEEKQQKALVNALQYLYFKLTKNEFDVRYLEKVVQGNYEVGETKVLDRHQEFNKSIFTTNNSSHKVKIPRHLRIVAGDQLVRLLVKSDLLQQLDSNDQQRYKSYLLDLAGILLGPNINAQTGESYLYLGSFQEAVRELSSMKGDNQILQELSEQAQEQELVQEQEKLPDQKPNYRTGKQARNKLNFMHKIFGSTLGTGFGFALGFGVKKLCEQYIQINPQWALPFVGCFSLLGGLSGYCITSKVLYKKK